jgi:hypothetical protein
LAPAARAALQGNCFSTMLVDTSLALALIDKSAWPEEYRSLPQPRIRATRSGSRRARRQPHPAGRQKRG